VKALLCRLVPASRFTPRCTCCWCGGAALLLLWPARTEEARNRRRAVVVVAAFIVVCPQRVDDISKLSTREGREGPNYGYDDRI